MNNHAFTIAFAVVTTNDNESVTKAELISALKKRISDLELSGDEIIEACGLPFDSYVVDESVTTNEAEEFSMCFEVPSADVTQSVRVLDPSYNKESIVEGLEAGVLATTTWFNSDEENKCIYDPNTDLPVALIIDQKVDGEYEHFRSAVLASKSI